MVDRPVIITITITELHCTNLREYPRGHEQHVRGADGPDPARVRRREEAEREHPGSRDVKRSRFMITNDL